MNSALQSAICTLQRDESLLNLKFSVNCCSRAITVVMSVETIQQFTFGSNNFNSLFREVQKHSSLIDLMTSESLLFLINVGAIRQ